MVTCPLFSVPFTLALIVGVKILARGPSASYLPEGAPCPDVFKKRKLADRPYAGRVCVVTGANRTMGYCATRSMSLLGAHIIMVDMEAQDKSIAQLRKEDPQASLVDVRLDLSDFDNLQAGALKIVQAACKLKGLAVPSSLKNSNNNNGVPCIDFLLNNAGMANVTRTFTREGFSKVFQVNHFGPYILTEWLLPYINKQQGRVINYASCAHTWWTLYPFSVDCAKSVVRALEIVNDSSVELYPNNSPYALSKFCNLVHASHLAKRFKAEKGNNNIVAASVHPGAVWTDIWRFIPYPLKYVTDALMAYSFKTPQEGHQTALHCLTAPHIINGQFYADCHAMRPRDEALDEQVWDAVDEYTRKAVGKWLPQ